MIYKGTVLKVVDNSGALYVRCFHVGKVRYGKIGDKIKVSVIRTIANSKIEKGSVQEAIIVGTKSPYFRDSGATLSFSYNSAVLVKPDGGPLATRISQVVPSHLDRAIKSIAKGVC